MKPMMVETHHGEITPQDQETVTYVETQPAVITKSESHRLKRLQWLLLISFYFSCSAIGAIGGPLLQRLYYMHGGTSKWLSCFLQSSGFPLLLIPLAIFYYRTASTNNSTRIIIHEFFMDTTLFFFAAASGLICGLSNYFYAAGLVYLPVSTSSLLFSTQLAFTAASAFFIVRQRFSFCSLNAVVVMTMGSVVLALHTSGDRPEGVSEGKYVSGFFMTLGSAALTGVFLPIIELAYGKSSRVVNVGMVLQVQVVINVFASLFCLLGMLINHDFKIIQREAREYELGERKYYSVLVTCAICWQLCFVGILGMIHYTSSLFAGITTAVILPLTEVAAVIVYHEKFTGEKGMSLALCLWGFLSYFTGEYKNKMKAHANHEIATKVSNNDNV